MITFNKLETLEFKSKGDFNLKLAGRVYALPWEFNGESSYVQVVLDEHDYVAKVEQKGEKIQVSIFGLELKHDPEEIARKALTVLGFYEDLSEYYSKVKNDPILHVIPEKLKGIRMRGRSTLWEALVISLCQQNASFMQGWSYIERLHYYIGRRVRLKGEKGIYLLFPKPKEILEKKNTLITCRMGYREKYLVSIAQIYENKFKRMDFSKMKTREIIRILKEVKGVGDYTAKLSTIVAFRRYEVFPADRWFTRIISEIYLHKKITVPQASRIAEKIWGKWAGLSAVFLTVVLSAETITKALQLVKSGEFREQLLNYKKPSPLTLFRKPLTKEVRRLLAK